MMDTNATDQQKRQKAQAEAAIREFMAGLGDGRAEIERLGDELRAASKFCRQMSQIGSEIVDMIAREDRVGKPPGELEGHEKNRRIAVLAVANAYPMQAQRASDRSLQAGRALFRGLEETAQREVASAGATLSRYQVAMSELSLHLRQEEGTANSRHTVVGQERRVLTARLKVLLPQMLLQTSRLERAGAAIEAAKVLATTSGLAGGAVSGQDKEGAN